MDYVKFALGFILCGWLSFPLFFYILNVETRDEFYGWLVAMVLGGIWWACFFKYVSRVILLH